MKMWKNAIMAMVVIVMSYGSVEAFTTSYILPDPVSVKLLGSEKDNSFRLIYHPVEREKTTLMLKDLKGKTLWKVKLGESEAFAKLMNLRNLPNGLYTLYVTGEDSELVQPLKIHGNEVEINPEQQEYYEFPGFSVSGNMVRVELNAKTDLNVKLAVYDSANETLYSDKLPVSGKLVRKLDLSDLKKGDYTVSVQTPYRTFYKKIEKR